MKGGVPIIIRYQHDSGVRMYNTLCIIMILVSISKDVRDVGCLSISSVAINIVKKESSFVLCNFC